jgi:hypothetical protein
VGVLVDHKKLVKKDSLHETDVIVISSTPAKPITRVSTVVSRLASNVSLITLSATLVLHILPTTVGLTGVMSLRTAGREYPNMAAILAIAEEANCVALAYGAKGGTLDNAPATAVANVLSGVLLTVYSHCCVLSEKMTF